MLFLVFLVSMTAFYAGRSSGQREVLKKIAEQDWWPPAQAGLFSDCGHHSYWMTFFGNCMACRAEKAEERARMLEDKLNTKREAE